MNKVVIFGMEKLAELAHFYLSNDTPSSVVAFTVDKQFIKSSSFLGLPVVPFEEVELLFPPQDHKMFVAVGYKKMNKVRAEKFIACKNRGYEFITYISSKATVWEKDKVGENCFILENQIIQPFVTIGNNVVIWGGCHFGHNVVIGDNCWISPHACICGGVSIGENSFIASNVTIRDNVKIGSECIIGAGSLILKDTKAREVYTGKPADLYRLDSDRFCAMMDISGNS